MESNKNALVIEDLTVHYVLEDETVEAVNGISLTVKKGEILGLVGETGAGKTTTALAAMHLVPDPPGVIKSGRIMLGDIDMVTQNRKALQKIRGKNVSMIFQDPMTSLNPVLPIGEQIVESIRLHENVTKNQAWEKAKAMLEMVGIPGERVNEYPHQFSGGMQQRVVIAIALACNPQLLITDEPTTALDVTIQAQVLDLMRNLKKQYDSAMILITHDLGIVADLCDTVAVMYAGRIVECGTLEEVFNRTRHPYTEGLFNSLPNINRRTDRLKPIQGLMPDPTKLPKGCAFAPRCPYAAERCIDERQTERAFSPTHKVLCCRYEESDFHIEREDRHD